MREPEFAWEIHFCLFFSILLNCLSHVLFCLAKCQNIVIFCKDLVSFGRKIQNQIMKLLNFFFFKFENKVSSQFFLCVFLKT